MRPRSSPVLGPVLSLVTLATCGLVGVSVFAGFWQALTSSPVVFGLAGFELVTLVAAGLGVGIARGAFVRAPALGLASVAGAFFAAATLGRFWFIASTSEANVTERESLTLLVRDAFFLGRCGAAGVLGAMAVCVAIGDDRARWRKFVIGAALIGASLAATLWAGGPGGGWLLAPVETFAGVGRIVLIVFGAIALIVGFSAGVHLLISAFDPFQRPPDGAQGVPRRG